MKTGNDDLLNVITNYKDVIIYGAGLVGKVVIKHVLKNYNNLNLFIAVSELAGNPGYIMGQRVYPIAELDHLRNSACVIIATMDNKKTEIMNYLIHNNFKNIIELNDQYYADLRSEDIDFSIDTEHEMHNIKQKMRAMEQRIAQLERNLSLYRKYYFDPDYDRKHQQSFIKYLSDTTTITKKYQNLVSKLDVDSIDTINLIMKRLQLIMNSLNTTLDIFTRYEQGILRMKSDEFNAHIIKISEELFCYKHYKLTQNSFSPEVFYYKFGLDRLISLDSKCKDDFIDVGAYIGDSALILSPLTQGKVFAFEAFKESYDIMQKTIELNHLNNVIPVNMALGSEEKIISLNIRENEASGNGCVKREGVTYIDEIQVAQDTLDNYVVKNNLNVGLIKVDIEGAEQDFLVGAIETIKKFKPILIISIYHSADDFFNIKPKLEALGLGYTFKIFKPILERSIISETLLLAEVIEK